MLNENYNVIGVMSGTSLDGVDLAHIHFTISEGKWSFQILERETIPYTNEWVALLKRAVTFDDLELNKLNLDYTELLGNIIFDFIKRNKISNLDAVCSHGHTILHQPEKGLTLQIGNLPMLAKIVKQTIVCDFRVQDVRLGGQGAPLVPIGDQILFSKYVYCLNLGGFANISFEENGNRIAFDISPVNTVLNYYANRLGFDYDDKGNIARSGKLNSVLLNQLNDLDFYKKSIPKSLGFEFVREIVLPLIEKNNIGIEDKMHTFTEHVAHQIALALPKKEGKLFVTGGGAYNEFLIDRLTFLLPQIEVIVPDSTTLEFKEALIFALLGVLKLRNEINVLRSVTGAKKDHSSGVIFQY
jgi:anhydro-N-acetylmuramic acid kinase